MALSKPTGKLAFAYQSIAILEAARKQDAALIRQTLESMCWAARVMTISEDEAPGCFAVISTASARLEGKPCA